MLGRPTLVYCVADIGSPPITYKWYRNNQLIDNQKFSSEVITIIFEPISNALGLIIQSVSVKHSANYSCIARNLFGEDKFTSPLIVKGNIAS